MDATTENLTEKDADELLVVELDDKGEPIVEEGARPAETGDEADDDTDDARLADDEGSEDGDESANRKRRKARTQRRKRAEELSKAEIAELRQQLATQHGQIQQLAGGFAGFNANTLAQRHQQKVAEVQQAETIIARAIEANNGQDVMEAMRYRDQAKDDLRQLEAASAQLRTAHQEPQQQPVTQPQVKPEIIALARKWSSANPWYNPAGSDQDSQTAKRIDAELVREGFDPANRDFWEELSDRCADAMTDSSLSARAPRRGPPVGANRNHAPSTTRKEIRVTPERKQAMIDAGVWEDPIKRQKYLKSYQEFDSRAAS